MRFSKSFLLPLLAALCACRLEGGKTAPPPAPAVAASAPAAAAPESALQKLLPGQTTLGQARALYPDLEKSEGDTLRFGNRLLTAESGAVAEYRGGFLSIGSQRFPRLFLTFDSESGLLQKLELFDLDGNPTPLLEALEAAGFAPHPHLGAEEFVALNGGDAVTPEEWEKALAETGMRQFKRGSLLAFTTPAGAGHDTAGGAVVNLAYEPEHRAKWERRKAAGRE